MGVNDAVQDLQQINNGASLSLQPNGSTEWTIHNVYHSDTASLLVTDGALTVTLDTHEGEGSWSDYSFHSTNSQYYQVKNTSGGSIITGFDAVVTQG